MIFNSDLLKIKSSSKVNHVFDDAFKKAQVRNKSLSFKMKLDEELSELHYLKYLEYSFHRNLILKVELSDQNFFRIVFRGIR